MNHITDLGGKVGTVLASIGSFIAAQVLSDTLLPELIRLFSSCIIAFLGAIIGYYVTKLLKNIDTKNTSKRFQAMRQWEREQAAKKHKPRTNGKV